MADRISSETGSKVGGEPALSGSFDCVRRKGATHSAQDDRSVEAGDEGFLLLGAIVLVFMVLLVLSVAAPRMAKEIQRDREVESEHRAQQYVRAIRIYYLKFHNYPGSIEQLEKTNNQRFLRQKYVDPLTGKDDWRLIHVGENQTQVKWMFGEELQGLQSGLGSAAGLASPSPSGFSSIGGSANGGLGGLGGGPGGGLGGGLGGAGNPPGGPGVSGASGGSTTTPGTTGSSTGGIPSQSATDFKGGGGAIMGVGSSKTGEAMLVVNEQTTYDTWEFLYDPRVEQYYQKANLLGGMGSGTGGSGFGSPVGTPIGTPATNPLTPTPSPSGTTSQP